MKKAFALMLALAFMCAFVPSARAAPEDMISIYAQASLSGNVMLLHVQIRNSQENVNSLQNIRVMTNSGLIFNFDAIPPGGMDMSTGAYYGAYEQDGSIRIAVLWTDGEAEYSREMLVPAGGSTAQTVQPVSVECIFPYQEVSMGQQITLSYLVVNSAQYPIEEVILSDDMIGEDIAGIARIEAGEQAVLEVPVTVNGNLQSRPRIKYVYQGREYAAQGEEKIMEVTISPIMITISADTTSAKKGETLEVSIWLDNQTGYDYFDIRVGDAILGEVYAKDKLAAGGSEGFILNIPVEGTRTHLFVLTAATPSGEAITARSQPLNVQALDEFGEITVEAELSVIPESTAIISPGKLLFRVLLRNRSGQTLEDIVVSERQAGELGGRKTLYTGQDFYFETAFDVAVSSELLFQATVRLQDGSEKVLVARPVDIRVGGTDEGENALSGSVENGADLSDIPFLNITLPEMDALLRVFFNAMAVVMVLLIAAFCSYLAAKRREAPR